MTDINEIKETTLNLLDLGKSHYTPNETLIILDGLYYIIEEQHSKGMEMVNKEIEVKMQYNNFVLELCKTFDMFLESMPTADWPDCEQKVFRVLAIREEFILTRDFNQAYVAFQKTPTLENKNKLIEAKNEIEERYS